MPAVADVILDGGLNALRAACDRIVVCDQEPLSFADVATYAIGACVLTPGAVFGAPQPFANGRVITTVPPLAGATDRTATATFWAGCSSTQLLVRYPLVAGYPLTQGVNWSLAPVGVALTAHA